MNRKHFLFATGAAALCGCARNANDSSLRYPIVGPDGAPLRAAFNDAAADVRLLLLVSPT